MFVNIESCRIGIDDDHYVSYQISCRPPVKKESGAFMRFIGVSSSRIIKGYIKVEFTAVSPYHSKGVMLQYESTEQFDNDIDTIQKELSVIFNNKNKRRDNDIQIKKEKIEAERLDRIKQEEAKKKEHEQKVISAVLSEKPAGITQLTVEQLQTVSPAFIKPYVTSGTACVISRANELLQ